MLFSFIDPEDSDDDFAFTKAASRENLKPLEELKRSMSLWGFTRLHNLLIRSRNEVPSKWQSKAFSITNAVITEFNTLIIPGAGYMRVCT